MRLRLHSRYASLARNAFYSASSFVLVAGSADVVVLGVVIGRGRVLGRGRGRDAQTYPRCCQNRALRASMLLEHAQHKAKPSEARY